MRPQRAQPSTKQTLLRVAFLAVTTDLVDRDLRVSVGVWWRTMARLPASHSQQFKVSQGRWCGITQQRRKDVANSFRGWLWKASGHQAPGIQEIRG